MPQFEPPLSHPSYSMSKSDLSPLSYTFSLPLFKFYKYSDQKEIQGQILDSVDPDGILRVDTGRENLYVSTIFVSYYTENNA